MEREEEPEPRELRVVVTLKAHVHHVGVVHFRGWRFRSTHPRHVLVSGITYVDIIINIIIITIIVVVSVIVTFKKLSGNSHCCHFHHEIIVL